MDYYDTINACQTEAGQHLLGLSHMRQRVVKLTENSVHFFLGMEGEKALIKAYFWTGKQVVREIIPVLTKMQIANNRGYQAFLHHAGLVKGQYPSVFLSSLAQGSGAGDGYCLNTDANFTTCRNAASSSSVDYTGTSAQLQATWVTSPAFFIGRVFLPFDTSSLTANAVISDATLQINGTPDGSNTVAPTATIVTTSQASTSSLATSDYSLIGASALAASNIDLTTSGTKTKLLNATGLAAINKSGTTKIGLRHFRDFDNTAPSSGGSNDVSRWDVNMSENGTPANRPLLTITYLTSGGILASEI